MSRSLRRLGLLAAALLVVAAPAAQAAPHDADVFDIQSGPELGHIHAKHAGAGQGASAPLLVYHGGTVMTSSAVTAIFWGTKFSSASYTGDLMTGLDKLYGGIGASAYVHSDTEYSGSNGQVGAASTYSGHKVDTLSSLRRAPSRTSQILTEVAKVITNPVPNGYYPVYTDLKRGNAGYCAWHSWGSINGVPVQFGFFFDLAGDPGCDPQDPSTTHSQALEALANVSGHELSEALTDPRGDAWYDGGGEENADKCAWTFGSSLLSIGGTSWKIQGNFSNAAFGARSGYDGAGCIDH
jgi:hypothetical protein